MTSKAKKSNSPGRWVARALEELVGIEQEAADEGLPEISAAAKEHARRILVYLARYPALSTVYPTEDGEVAVLFRSCIAPSSVLILLEDSGRAVCIAYKNRVTQRRRYDHWCDLPDEFVEGKMRALGSPVRSDNVA